MLQPLLRWKSTNSAKYVCYQLPESKLVNVVLTRHRRRWSLMSYCCCWNHSHCGQHPRPYEHNEIHFINCRINALTPHNNTIYVSLPFVANIAQFQKAQRHSVILRLITNKSWLNDERATNNQGTAFIAAFMELWPLDTVSGPVWKKWWRCWRYRPKMKDAWRCLVSGRDATEAWSG